MHLQHAADTLAVALHRVEHLGAAGQHARIDPHERQRADERIGHDLEGEAGERLGVVGLAGHFVVAIDLEALHRRHVQRRRQEIDDRIQYQLHTLVLDGGAAQHRHEGAGDGTLADQLLQGIGVRLSAIGNHHRFIERDAHLDELLAHHLGLFLQAVRNFADGELGAWSLVLPDHAFHGDQVDQADEIALDANRQLGHQRLRAETVLDHLQAAIIVRAGAVHLVDEADARHAVLVGMSATTPPTAVRRRLRSPTPITAPSSTRSERSTSMVKSTWPGVLDDVDAMARATGREIAGDCGRSNPVSPVTAPIQCITPIVGRRMAHDGGCARSSWSCRHRCGP